MKLSTIIVSWNTKEILAQCLDSLIAEQVEGGHEILVVDNASTDGSPEMVRERYPEVILMASRENVLRLGGRTHKNKTGFDLHRLFVGSEGLLGVITEATLKLLPLPPYRANLAVGFSSMRAAVRAMYDILSAGFLPTALELDDAFTLAAA